MDCFLEESTDISCQWRILLGVIWHKRLFYGNPLLLSVLILNPIVDIITHFGMQ